MMKTQKRPLGRQDIVKEIIDETTRSVPQITNYRTGGIFRLFIEVVASFLEKIYQELEEMLPNRFLQTAKEEYLDLKARELSLERQVATKTRGYVIFSRSTSTNNSSQSARAITIAKDKIIATKPNTQGLVLRYKVLSDVVLQENETTISILVEAEEKGSQYNVVGNQIIDIITPINGIDFINNTVSWIAQVGKDIESDESLRSRCLALWQGLSGANKGAYISWAKSIPEVEDVRVVPTARGLGTVDIIFTKTNNALPDNELLEKVQNIIDEYKPIATDAEVKAPKLVSVDITANIIILPNSKLSKNNIEEITHIYFAKLHIGEDFEPSALSGFLFSQLEGMKSILLDTERKIVSELQIASLGRIDINISTSDHF